MSTPKTIIERVNSVEDALQIAGKSLADFSTHGDTPDEVAYKVLKTVIKVLNEDRVPDYSNSYQYKYEPYFRITPGSGLSFVGYVPWASFTHCGVRLCYASYDLMIHGVKILEKYYTYYLTF